MELLLNDCWKVYFIQLSPKEGGNIVYKFGSTQYKDVLHRFSNSVNEFNIKPLCSLVFKSKDKAEAFENMLLGIYKNYPASIDISKYEKLRGTGELRALTNVEKMEVLNFMFRLKDIKGPAL